MRPRIFVILVAAIFAACSPTVYIHGVPNLYDVDGDYVYRSGQITTDEGWDYVKQLAHGRRVHVVKLNFDAEGKDDGALDRGFSVLYVPIQPEGDQDLATDIWDTFKTPDAAHIESAKSELLRCKLHPDTDVCLVHCTHGQDRTGEVVGEYRVEEDDWTKDRAYQEMIGHHYHPELYGLHERWVHYQPPPKNLAGRSPR